MMTSITVFAQNGINTPYSRYGFGVQAERAMGFNKGMGGVAQGFRDGQIVNVANPASYSAVDSLSAIFDLGLSVYNSNFKMGGLQQNAKNSSIDYAAFHFRATKNVGVAVGILPYTNINYSFNSSSEKLSGTEDVTSSYSFTGDGGLHQVFLGFGWQPFKPVSIGVNGSYLYGDYTHSMTMSYSESSAYSMIRGYNANINTYMVDFGLQITAPINKKDKITLGASYSLGHGIKSKAVRYTQTLSSGNVQGETRDTIKNAFELPQTFAAGITYYHSNRLRIGADFELQKWASCKFPSQDMNGTGAYISTAGQLNDRMKISLGGDITPNPIARSYAKRMTYKVGGYFSQPYAKADPTGLITDKPYEFGVSAGFTLPIQNRNIWHNSPKVNIALQWVHSNIPYLNNMTKKKDTLTENYLKLCVGVTFNERWFYKWKVQ